MASGKNAPTSRDDSSAPGRVVAGGDGDGVVFRRTARGTSVAMPPTGPQAPDAAAPDDAAATITPYRDGPLIVRGDFRLVAADGTPIDPGRDTVALCRCGRSALKPFCDGSHEATGFAASGGDERPPRSARRLAAAPD
jgi:CDGSH-type Zn-finger protein